jgi:hypothetical protein
MSRPPVAAPDREYSESEVRGNHRKPPHLPVVGAGNSFDPSPARRRQEAKRWAQWRQQSPIGEEIAHCNRHARPVFFKDTARTDGKGINK